MNTYREFLVYVLDQVLTSTHVIESISGKWALTRNIAGMGTNQSYDSKEQLVASIADHYVSEAQANRVPGLRFDAGAGSLRKAG